MIHFYTTGQIGFPYVYFMKYFSDVRVCEIENNRLSLQFIIYGSIKSDVYKTFGQWRNG